MSFSIKPRDGTFQKEKEKIEDTSPPYPCWSDTIAGGSVLRRAALSITATEGERKVVGDEEEKMKGKLQ